jgi:hypothetical protein
VQAFCSEKAGQCKNQTTTKKTYSASTDQTPQARKEELHIKKDIKCFQTNENIFGLSLLNSCSVKSMEKSGLIC